MGRKVIVGLVLIFLAMFGYSEAGMHPPTLNTPWLWNITSSFGPRKSSGTYFHYGIDYGGIYGANIRAIENGYIVEIGDNIDDRGYYITYKSNKIYPENGAKSSQWDYFHMFLDDASTYIPSTKWEFATGYTLVNSRITTNIEINNVIIKWFNKSANQATQVLCAVKYDGYYVQSNGNNIVTSKGNPILAKGRITGSDYLGPVGNSGAVPAHLHVALNDQLDNPLFYLKHGNHWYTPNTDAGFTIPANSIIASPVDDLKYRLKADVITSVCKNYDLDEVRFFIDGKLQHDNYGMESKFCFGGRPDYGIPYPSWIIEKSFMSSHDATTGVHPLKNSDSTPTNFRFVSNVDLCNLPPGGHRFTVKAVDVNGYITTNGADFTIGVVVPDDYASIQEAIDAAGDSCKSRKICVRDGIYKAHIDFRGKAVWLRSEHGAASTTIDGSGGVVAETFTYSAYTPPYDVTMLVERLNGSVVTFANSEMHSSVLDGFTIANGSGTTSTFLEIQDDGYGILSYRWTETNGGGIYCASSSPTINSCIISGNTAIAESLYDHWGNEWCTPGFSDSRGGGIYCGVPSESFHFCIYRDLSWNCGPSWVDPADSLPIITNCVITNNSVKGRTARGGGIFCYWSYNSTLGPTITNCIVTGNSASASSEASGGGISAAGYTPATISNCTISGNSIDYNVVQHCYYSVNHPYTCTVSNDASINCCYDSSIPTGAQPCFPYFSAGAYGGGVDGTDSNVTNCILWGNSSSGNGLWTEVTGGTHITYSDIEGGFIGTGNISANPMFAGGSDYHLQAGSPCIDNGTLVAVSTDFDGNKRSLGTGYDMGAYEYVPPANTSAGQDTNISFFPNSATTAVLAFDNITNGGETTLTSQSQYQGPAMLSGFEVLGGNYYDISTTAQFTGNITVYFAYDSTNLTSAQEQKLRLMCYKNGVWQDVTTLLDTDNHAIFGQVSSLSQFAIVYSLKTTPTVTWNNPADIAHGTALSETQLNAVTSVTGTFIYTPAAGTVLNAGNGQTLSATFIPSDTANYTGASASVTINVLKAAPTITWSNPADIVYGTVLTGSQLNATASVPGTFTYTPMSGAILNAGSSQTLHVNFVPTDTTVYTSASAGVTINVTQKAITVTADAKSKVYGQNNPALTYTCTPSLVGSDSFIGSLVRDAGVNVGIYSIRQGTLTLNTNYTLSYVGAAFTINQATATVTLSNLTQTYNNTLLSPTADTNPAGLAIIWTNVPQINPGSYNVKATINDSNYLGSASGTFTISKITPSIIWSTPANITYGTALSSTQLNATASVSGIFSYTPRAGTILNAGNGRTLQVNFTPTDTTNYNNALASVTINVAKANQTINFGALANKTYGDADFTVSATATSGLAVTFTATGKCTVAGNTVHITGAGSGTITAQQAGNQNYIAASDVAQIFSIYPKAASVTPNAASKAYGNPDPVLTGTLTGFLPSDNVTASYSRTGSNDVGIYTINATLSPTGVLDNYSITYNTASFAIIVPVWQYRWPITITNNNGLVTQYQIGEIKLQWNNIHSPNYIGSPAQAGSRLFSSTGADMRFTDSDGVTFMPFWRRSWNTSSKISSVWVKVPQLPAHGVKTIYLWGGGNGAVTEDRALNSYSRTMTKLTDTTADDCEALWHMDEGSGDMVRDFSGNDHHGTRKGITKPAWQTTDGGQWANMAGQIFSSGSHLYFSGGLYSSHIKVEEAYYLPLGLAPRTVMAWIKRTENNWGDIVSYGNAPVNDFTVGIRGNWIPGSSSPKIIVSKGVNYCEVDTNINVNDGNWHHVAVSYDWTSHAYVYLDGTLLGTRAFVNYTTGDTVVIGASILYSNYFIGNIDEVAIYNSALTSNHIKAHYYRRKYAGDQMVSYALGGVNTPATPVNVSPVNGAIGVSVTPTLIASAFHSTEGDTHQKTQWQIRAANGSYDAPVYTITVSDTYMTTQSSYTVPSGILLGGNAAYYWRVRYKGSRGLGWSAYSDETSFITTSVISGWPYRWPITITNNNGLVTQYQIGEIKLQWSNIYSPNYIGSPTAQGTPLFSSYTMRFTDSDGQTFIPFWRRSWSTTGINSGTSSVWVKVPQLPANSIKTIYLWGSNRAITDDTPLNSYSWTMAKLTDTTANGCVALWHMDAGSGTTVSDASGNGYNGTIYSGASAFANTWISSDGGQWTSQYRKFSSGSQLRFNGTSNYVNFGKPSAVNFGNGNFTFEAWVKLNSLIASGTKMVIAKDDGVSNKQFIFDLDANKNINHRKIEIAYWTTSGVKVFGRSPENVINDTNWHHVAAGRNSGAFFMYVDGASQILSTAGSHGTMNSCINSLMVGKRRWVTDPGFFPGYIDEVAIYNSALASNQIKAHYYRRKYAGAQAVNYALGGMNTPATPVNVSPVNGAIGVSVTPTLIASAFHSTEGDIHQYTQWQIRAANGSYDSPVYSPTVTDTSMTTQSSCVIPSNKLMGGNVTYYWRVRYKGSRGGDWSAYSDETSFITTSAISGWPYRWPIAVINGNNTVLSNFQVGEIMLQWNHINSPNYIGSSVSTTPLFSSYTMRFTDSDGVTPIPFWRRSWHDKDNSKISSVWVKVPQIPANGIKTIYLWGSNKVITEDTPLNSYSLTMTKLTDTTANSCVALWHMDNGSGQVTDSSGNGNASTTVNATWLTTDGGQWNSQYRKFNSGSQLKFNGTSNYVNFVNPSAINFGSGNFTFEAWVKLSSLTASGSEMVIGKDNGINSQFILDLDANNNNTHKIRICYWTSGGKVWGKSPANAINDTNWHHIAAGRSGSAFFMYVDGISQSIPSVSSVPHGTMNSSIASLMVGKIRRTGSEGFFPGCIDEVAIYNRALPVTEIQAHYYRRKYEGMIPVYILGGLNTPNTPVNVTPADGAYGVSVTPTLIASVFHGTWGDIHQQTQWQIRAANGSYDLPVYDKLMSVPSTSHIIPSNILRGGNTLYFWRVRYKGIAGWSFYSDETSFITTSAISNWPYRWPVTITNNNNNTVLTNFQVELKLQWNNSISSNYIGSSTTQGTPLFSSYAMRFTDSDGQTLIPFWRRSWNTTGINSGISSVWVKVPVLEANSIHTIYLWGSNMPALDVSNYSQTMTKITDTTANSCVALWHMDEGSGSTAIYDASGNSNNGTLVNNPVWQAIDGGQWAGVPGPVFDNGSHLLFNGNKYISAGTTNLPLGTTPRTVTAWINTTMTGRGEIVSYGTGSTGNAFTVGVYGSKIFVSAWANDYQVNANVNDGKWHQVTVSYDGTYAYVYLDGTLLDTRVFTINTLSGTANIGARIAPLTEYFIDYMDEVAIYNRVLSQAEIQAQYYRRKYAVSQPTWAIRPRE